MNPRWREYLHCCLSGLLFALAAALLCWGRVAHSMNAAQSSAVREAVQIAQHITPSRYFAAIFVAVIGEESSYCQHLVNDSDPSYGCGAMQTATAAQVAGRPISAYALIHDRTLNLTLSARYLYTLVHTFGYARGLYAYNHGWAVAAHVSEHVAWRSTYVRAVYRIMLRREGGV